MATYLFAWNPVYWDWPELPYDIKRLARQGHVDIGWASGRTRSIEPGSRAFMVRLGTPPKGLIGAGYTLTPPTPGKHWIDSKVKAGVPALHLKLRLEVLAPTPIVSFDDLARPPFARFRWGVRSSGTRVPSPRADPLAGVGAPRGGAWGRAAAVPKPRANQAKRASFRQELEAIEWTDPKATARGDRAD